MTTDAPTLAVKPVTVMVFHVDRNDDNPGLNWIVGLLTDTAQFSLQVMAADNADGAVDFASSLAVANRWSLDVRSAS